MKMYKYSCFYFLLCLLVYFIVLNCLEIILKKKIKMAYLPLLFMKYRENEKLEFRK